MTHEPISFSSDWIAELNPERIPLIDWFAMEGAELLIPELDEGQPTQINLGDQEFYIGEPICDDEWTSYAGERWFTTEHVVEIAALFALGTSLNGELLNQLVEPLRVQLAEKVAGHEMVIEVAEDFPGNCVWVVRRFTDEEQHGESFDALMREYLALCEEVEEAIF